MRKFTLTMGCGSGVVSLETAAYPRQHSTVTGGYRQLLCLKFFVQTWKHAGIIISFTHIHCLCPLQIENDSVHKKLQPRKAKELLSSSHCKRHTCILFPVFRRRWRHSPACCRSHAILGAASEKETIGRAGGPRV